MPWIPEAGEGIFYGGNLELSLTALRYSKFTSSPKKVILARLLPTSNAVTSFVQDYQLGRIYGENVLATGDGRKGGKAYRKSKRRWMLYYQQYFVQMCNRLLGKNRLDASLWDTIVFWSR